MGDIAGLRIAFSNMHKNIIAHEKSIALGGWMDGWMDDWMDGWVGGW